MVIDARNEEIDGKLDKRDKGKRQRISQCYDT